MPQMTIPEIFRSITHTVTRVVGMVPASDYDDLVGELEDLKFDRAMSEATLQAAFRRIHQTHALERFAHFVGLEDVIITDDPETVSYDVNFDMARATEAFAKLGLRFEEIIIEEDITDKVTSDEPVKGAERLGDFVTQKFADPATPENQLKSTDAIGVLDKAIDDFDDDEDPEVSELRPPTEHVDPPGYKPPTEFNVGGKKFKGER